METRRRGTALEEAILRAAAQVLEDSGYAGLTMEKVAQRAGTNKNAIYRRWPGRPDLAVAAYGHLAETQMPAVDTGSLRSDALTLLRLANDTWSSPRGALLRALLAAAADEPALLSHLRAAAGASVVNDAWTAAMSRAVARGEAVAAADHPRVVSLPMTLLRGEYAVRGEPTVPDEVLVEIVDEVFLPLVRGRGN